MDLHSELFVVDREITKIKTMHMLGAISYKDAKKRITRLDSKLKKLLDELPEDEREIYNFKKELKLTL